MIHLYFLFWIIGEGELEREGWERKGECSLFDLPLVWEATPSLEYPNLVYSKLMNGDDNRELETNLS